MNARNIFKHIFKVIIVSASISLSAGVANAQTKGGTLNVILNPEPPTLIFGLNQQTPTQLVGGKIYEGLLTYDFDFKPKPGLAKTWEISSDGLTYTFHLQDNITWHDGTPFTSKDVIFTTKEFLPEVHSRARANFSYVKEFQAPDDKTVIFKLSKPYAAFINAFEVSSAPMMPAHLYQGKDYRNNTANQTPIGTGPFKFKEWKKGQYVHLVRNDHYWKSGLPYLDGIYFQIIPDAASRLMALESGKVQVASYSDIDFVFLPKLRTSANLDVTTKGYEFAGPHAWIELNHRGEPLSDKRFRQAIMFALDRDFIAKRIFFGAARPATGPISSVTKYYDPNIPQYKFDPQKAVALLDEMGLKPDEKGVRATVKLLGLPYGDTWNKLSEYIKQALGKVGVNVVLESTDSGNWARRFSNWEFEMLITYMYQYSDPALGVSRSYLSNNIRKGVYGSNTSGYKNPKVDELFNQATYEIDPVKRQKLYSEVATIIADDAAEAWLVELAFTTITNKKVKNVTTSALGVTENFATTYIEK